MPSQVSDPTRPLHVSCLPAGGWFVVSYVLRLVHVDRPGNDDLDGRFKTWENTVLVRAETPRQAWDKVQQVAAPACEPYENADGETLRWNFEGVSDLLAIYEELEDGAEIMWADHAPRTLKRIRRMVRPLEAFVRYADER